MRNNYGDGPRQNEGQRTGVGRGAQQQRPGRAARGAANANNNQQANQQQRQPNNLRGEGHRFNMPRRGMGGALPGGGLIFMRRAADGREREYVVDVRIPPGRWVNNAFTNLMDALDAYEQVADMREELERERQEEVHHHHHHYHA